MREAKNILLTGAPGVGKTTLITEIAARLRELHPVGFFTEEIREGGGRRGFSLVSLEGGRSVLSHVDCESPLTVGKYRVNLAAFEAFLDSIFPPGLGAGVLIIDEIGKMECISGKFRELITELLDSDKPVIATIAKRGDAFIEGIKRRHDVVVYELTRSNRETMADVLLGSFREG